MSKQPQLENSQGIGFVPGPAGFPLIGNLIEARRDTLQFVLDLSRNYGPIARYRIGGFTGYSLHDPKLIGEVLQANPHTFSKDNLNYNMLKPVLGEGLLTSDGDEWLRQRRMVQPLFHRERLERLSEIPVKATLNMLRCWDERLDHNDTVDLSREMAHLTLEVLGQSFFNTELISPTHRLASAFSTLNREVTHRFQSLVRLPLWVPSRRNLAYRRALKTLEGEVYQLISGRRQSPQDREDLLGALLHQMDSDEGAESTDQRIRDQVMTILLAGHETTATLLSWTWYLISLHPATEERLRAEVENVLKGRLPTADDLSRLVYAGRVIDEALRLYPPVWIISRTAEEAIQLAGKQIPAGSVITISPYAMHRHPDYWNNSEAFDPDRFKTERSENRPAFVYFPFGGGPRICIGSHFAMIEAKLVLSTMLQRVKLELAANQEIEPEPLVTLRPRGGLPMKVHKLVG